MREALLIGLGGFLGTILRYAVSGAAHLVMRTFDFPVGTLVVNVLGSFVLVLLASMGESLGLFGPAFRSFMFIGLLGAFTTFSTFSLETMALLSDGQAVPAAANVAANVGLCLAAAVAARSTVLWIWR